MPTCDVDDDVVWWGSCIPGQDSVLAIQRSTEVALRSGDVEKRSHFLRQWRRRRLSLWPSGLDWKVFMGGDEQDCGVIFFDPCSFGSARVVSSGGQSGHDFEVVACENQKSGKTFTFFRASSANVARQWVQAINAAAKEAEEKVRAAEWCFVKLHIYHVHQSTRVRMLNFVTEHMLQVGGVFHTGLEVYDREYSFGSLPAGSSPDDTRSGVFSCEPRGCTMHTYLRTVCLGLARTRKDDFLALIREPSPAWQASTYHILTRNCVTFCRMLAERLCPGGDEFPAWVDSLAQVGGLVASGFRKVAADAEVMPRGVQSEQAAEARHGRSDQESYTLSRRASSTIALFVAAEEGQSSVVEACIADGAAPDSMDDRGRTPLMAAASRGEVATCRALLDAHAETSTSSPQGLTALMVAARGGHSQVVVLLLERGAPVAAVDADGRTALAGAAEAGCAEVCVALVGAMGSASSEFIARELPSDAAALVRAAAVRPCKRCACRGRVGLLGPIGFGLCSRSCPPCKGNGQAPA